MKKIIRSKRNETNRKVGKLAILKTIMTMLCLSLCLTVNVKTVEASSNYKVKSANFILKPLKTGDMQVTETWTVNYNNKTFSSFFRNGYLGETVEQIGTISNMKFYVNDVECTKVGAPVNVGYREDFTYFMGIPEDNKTTLQWYYNLKESDTDVEYKAIYTLVGAIKQQENSDKAYTAYRLVSNGFQKPIKNINIAIDTSELEYKDIRYSVDKAKNPWWIAMKNYKGTTSLYDISVGELPIRVNLEFNSNNFSDLKSYSKNELKPLSTLLGFYLTTLILMSLVFIPLIICIRYSLRIKRYKKKLLKNPNLFIDTLNHLDNNIEFAWFNYSSLYIYDNTIKLLYYLKYRGLLQILGKHEDKGRVERIISQKQLSEDILAEENIVITKDLLRLNKNEIEVINKLCESLGYIETTKYFVLDSNIFLDGNVTLTNVETLAPFHTTGKHLIKNLKPTKEQKKAIKFLNWYIDKYKIPSKIKTINSVYTHYDIIDKNTTMYDILKNSDITWEGTEEIAGYTGLNILTLYLLSTKKINILGFKGRLKDNKLNESEAMKLYKNQLEYRLDLLEDIAKKEHATSNNDSNYSGYGCSSCSSCGGCGGAN